MLDINDFDKKQIVFAFFNKGESLSFRNDNVIIKDENGKIKSQLICYRLFLLVIVGHLTMTTGLIQRCRKFGFSIVFMTPGFRVYHMVSAEREGNTLLRYYQYHYDSLDLAKHITENKVKNQISVLQSIRKKEPCQKLAIEKLQTYITRIPECNTLEQIMGYEGTAARIYFENYFMDLPWQSRRPRIKSDMMNASLDIGYTILFNFMEMLLSHYGFDLYQGVMHRNFYMRKSLVCDMVEPFRVLIDMQLKKSINLKQFKEDDFRVKHGRYDLIWQKSSDYTMIFLKALMNQKDEMFRYVQSYYRSFMKQKPGEEFPVYQWGE